MEQGMIAQPERKKGKRKPFVMQPRKVPRRWHASEEVPPAETTRRVFPRHFRNPAPLAGPSKPLSHGKTKENDGSLRRRRLTLIDIVKSRRVPLPLDPFL